MHLLHPARVHCILDWYKFGPFLFILSCLVAQLLANMDHLRLAIVGLVLALAGLSSGASTDGDCLSILEESQILSATYPNR